MSDQGMIPGGDDWREPMPIELPSLPAFPVDAMPEPLRSWIAAVAEECQVPPELPALLALAVCGGMVARRMEMVAGGCWREPLNLYVACLLEPAHRKSAVFKRAMEPVRRIEHELREAEAPEVARAEADRRMREKELAALEKKGAGGCGESREAARNLAAEMALEPIPSLPKLIVDDATAEVVEMTLATQGGRLIVAGAEGGLFDVMGGRYSGGAANLDVFLKGHAGDDLRVDRVSRGSLMVDRCCLSLCYAIQPAVIQGLGARREFRGRGLIGRFLYAVPESLLGVRRINPVAMPESVAANYGELVRRLWVCSQGVDPGPALLSWSPSADARFIQWQGEVESWLGSDGRLAELRDWGGKLAGLTARLAGILHLISIVDPEPWREPVGLPAVDAAITLSRWAVPHAQAVLGLMCGGDRCVDDAIYLRRWLRSLDCPEFSRRDAQQHGRARFDGAPERLDEALELLVERGWIRPLMPIPAGPGRPPSVRFAVNPMLSAGPRKAAAAVPAVAGERVRGVI
jgi:hypothetical protein